MSVPLSVASPRGFTNEPTCTKFIQTRICSIKYKEDKWPLTCLKIINYFGKKTLKIGYGWNIVFLSDVDRIFVNTWYVIHFPEIIIFIVSIEWIQMMVFANC